MTDFHISRDTEDLRDSFLISEFEYIAELAKTPAFKAYYQQYKGEDIDVLSNRLKALHQMMDEGKIKKEDEEKVELQMICCCLAIEDEIRELIMLKRSELEEKII